MRNMEDTEDPAILPLHSDFSATAFRPYVLDAVGAGLLVPLMRRGFLLCVPVMALDAEAVLVGQTAEPADLIGPSTKVEVQAAVLDEDALLRQPSPAEGRAIVVMLVDFSAEVGSFLTVLDTKDVLEALISFDFLESTLVPWPQDVVTKALAWANGEGEQVAERIQYYSADEVPVTPTEAPKRAPRRRGPGAGFGGDESTAQRRKLTVASLAESIAAITQALLEITSTLADLKGRTEAMEAELRVDHILTCRTLPAWSRQCHPEKFTSSAEDTTCHFFCRGGKRDGAGLPGGRIRTHSGDGSAVTGFDYFGFSSDSNFQRSIPGSWINNLIPVYEGGCQPCKAADRTCSTEGELLCQRDPTDGQTDATCNLTRCRNVGTSRQRHHADAVPGSLSGRWA